MPIFGISTVTMVDKSSESSTITVASTALTEAIFDAQGLLRVAFVAGVNGLSLGLNTKNQFGNCDVLASSNSASTSGSREVKLLVRYHDVVTFKNYNMEIPVFNEALTLPASDEIDPTGAAWIAFVTAAELFVLSPFPANNAIIVDGGTLVGRNI